MRDNSRFMSLSQNHKRETCIGVGYRTPLRTRFFHKAAIKFADIAKTIPNNSEKIRNLPCSIKILPANLSVHSSNAFLVNLDNAA